MVKEKTFFYIFIIFTVVVRWFMSPRLLPQSWTDKQDILITANIVNQPYLNDKNYIIYVGKYKLVFSSPKLIRVGDTITVFGKPNVEVIGKKQIRVVLYDPTIKSVSRGNVSDFSIVEKTKLYLIRFQQNLLNILQKSLPEPHSSLAAGILLGVKANMPSEFYQALVNTGTLHVIAASGYNINIVIRIVMGIVLTMFNRKVGLVVGFLTVVVYIVISGGSAAVIRASLMGILSYSAYYWGRIADAKRVVWIVGWAMLIFDPLYLVDVGFQLSFMATLGILYLDPLIRRCGKLKIFRTISAKIKLTILEEYLSDSITPTLAATIFTMPVIIWWFGRVSLISPIVNIFVLWVVPMIMFISAIVIIMGIISMSLARVFALALFIPLEYFVRVVELFG